ncbi:MAG: energy transducer TonB [Terracidiphilus sp.]
MAEKPLSGPATTGRATFGLLPEAERSVGSFITSMAINGLMLSLFLYLGAAARKTIDQHRHEETLLILPTNPPPQPKPKIPPPPPIKDPPKLVEVKFEAPKIRMPKPEPKPDLKPIQMEAKLAMPVIKEAKPAVILSPQPKSALAAAAMPAQDNRQKPSTAPVHFGQTFGVTPNPNATRPATVAAIGNPYGGMRGPAVAPHGLVGSTGFGNGTKFGSNAGVVGKVASAPVPGTMNAASTNLTAKVASVGIPTATVVRTPVAAKVVLSSTQPEVSIPKPTYTDEARHLKIQGNVVLRVTFFANGQIQVLGVLQGLGHGLDEQARSAVQQGRVLRPATRNGQAVNMTTNITITFQLA